MAVDGRATVVDDFGGADPTTVIRLDALQFTRLCGGRSLPAARPAEIGFDGDAEVGQRIVENLNYVIYACHRRNPLPRKITDPCLCPDGIVRGTGDQHQFVDTEVGQSHDIAGHRIPKCHREPKVVGVAPAARHRLRSNDVQPAASSTSAMLNPYQPSPHAATRRNAASLLPPSTTGIWRLRGLGLMRTLSNATNSP